jgi:hypothetical protein
MLGPRSYTIPHPITSGLLLSLALLVLWLTPVAAGGLRTPEGKTVFVRGVCLSPYHPREGWELSPATKSLDQRLIVGLGANCILPTQATTLAEVAAWQKLGIYTIPQILYSPAKVSTFANGYDCPVPVYVSEENRKSLRDAARDQASALKGGSGLLAVSLGSEYAWSAYSGDLGFTYGGFDDDTLAAYRSYLKGRFGTAEQYNEMTGKNLSSLDEALPPVEWQPSPAFWEWWRFMREAFEGYLQQAQEGVRAIGWDCPTTYQFARGVRWDPASEGSRLRFLDILSGDVFREQALSWPTYCAEIDRLVSSAGRRPVLVSQTGAHTLHVDPAEAARRLKQSVACILLHPEVGGIGLYEYCDQWARAGKPDAQEDTDAREFWGLVTADRAPKQTYRAATEMFRLIQRNEDLLVRWKSPPRVLVSQQDLDWWKLGIADSQYHERIAAELYRSGVSFRFVDSDGLLSLDPQTNPRLVLCDSILGSNPDGSADAVGRLISYVENGGNLLYISRMPWQQLYGKTGLPPEFVPGGETTPVARGYGHGQVGLLPVYEADPGKLRYYLLDYLAEALKDRPVASVDYPEGDGPVYWRVFEDGDDRWLLMVNVGDRPVQRLKLILGPKVTLGQLNRTESDGGGLRSEGKDVVYNGLNVYALIKIRAPKGGW